MVASEALASGLPMIVPDRGGSSAVARAAFADRGFEVLLDTVGGRA